jgi:hypothetical protein
MKAVPAAVVVGALVAGGSAARGKSPTIYHGIGIAGVAVGLALLEQGDAKLASAFAWLIIAGTAMAHFDVISKGIKRVSGGSTGSLKKGGNQ